jgi:3-hydroxyacyl-CoA dehydrogenase/enoyl-CoA hydratase/3-hydroxybutyryl-CoA epimerase
VTDSAIPPELEDRLMLPMLNESIACCREGIVADGDLLDAGVVFATGFAPFRGGPLQYAKDRGIHEITRKLGELAERYGERFRPDRGWEQFGA